MVKELYKEIENFLQQNDADYADISINPKTEEVEISISWGDWKHSHARLRNLMLQLGYVRTDSVTTESDGSDCYSAIHKFSKI